MTSSSNHDIEKRVGQIINQVQSGASLTRLKAAETLSLVLADNSKMSDCLWAGFFSAIQSRGPRLEELEGFVDAVFDYDSAFIRRNTDKIAISCKTPLVAITGSGKDSWKTFNISTTASFIAASLGCTVLKPGSHALSSTSGSLDILNFLDLPDITSVDVAGELLETEGLALFSFSNSVPKYAKRYNGRFLYFHPLSYVLPPLAIPFKLDALVYGIADTNTELSLDYLSSYGPNNCAVVATLMQSGLITDELIPFGTSMFSGNINGNRFFHQCTNPLPERLSEIGHQSTHKANATALLNVLTARDETLAVRAASMASAAILVTAGLYENIQEAYDKSIAAVLSGSARATLERYRKRSNELMVRIQPVVANTFTQMSMEQVHQVKEQIDVIAIKYGYAPVTPQTIVNDLPAGYLAARFSCHDNLDTFEEVAPEDQVIVTGFGPTNAPTAGTLSVIMKALELQKRLGCEAEIIISDVGAFLSRNKSWTDLSSLTAVFMRFIAKLTAGNDKILIRSHIDKDNLGIASFINEHILDTQTFLENKEATELLYEELGLLGSKFGIIADSTYTVADIIKPFFNKNNTSCKIYNKKRVLVIAGPEEHYFPRLAKIALQRLKSKFGNTYIDMDTEISALYTRLIPGFSIFPKMSKSIPESGVCLNDNPADIIHKIVECSEEDHHCILEMVLQASDWNDLQLSQAIQAFNNRIECPDAWRQIQIDYSDTFQRYAVLWTEARHDVERQLANVEHQDEQ